MSVGSPFPRYKTPGLSPALSRNAFMESVSFWAFLLAIAISSYVAIEPAPADLIFVMAAAALMLAGFRKGRIFGGIEITAGLLYLWFSLFSMLFVVYDTGIAYRALGIELYMYVIYLLVAYFVFHGGDLAFRRILFALLIAGALTSAVGLAAKLGLVSDPIQFYRDEFAFRLKSTFKDPNVLGPFMIPCVLASLYIAVSERKWRLFALIAFVTFSFICFVTYSRGAWAHYVISVSFFYALLLLLPRTSRAALVGGVVAAFLTGIFLAVYIGTGAYQDGALSQNVVTRFGVQYYDESRFADILSAYRLIIEHPFGLGPNQSPFYTGFFPHNTFVLLAVHNGVLAALGFAIIYFAALFRCAGKVISRKPGWIKYGLILSILLGLLPLINVVGANHWRHFFLVIGLAYGRYTRNGL